MRGHGTAVGLRDAGDIDNTYGDVPGKECTPINSSEATLRTSENIFEFSDAEIRGRC